MIFSNFENKKQLCGVIFLRTFVQIKRFTARTMFEVSRKKRHTKSGIYYRLRVESFIAGIGSVIDVYAVRGRGKSKMPTLEVLSEDLMQDWKELRDDFEIVIDEKYPAIKVKR
ncbi:MAG: hypothetical protein ACKOZV_00970 [Bacteroidota bacterium]